MKLEFLENEEINDGRQIFIEESEFRKASNNKEEFYSFAFATHCLFAFYGEGDRFITHEEYDTILVSLEKGGAVIITVVEERYPRRIYPEVYVSNKNRLKKVEL